MQTKSNITNASAAPKYLHYPGPDGSPMACAKDIIARLNDASPFSTTFLSTEPGCEAVDAPLARAIENAMEKAFRNWEQSWIRPRAEEIVHRLTPRK